MSCCAFEMVEFVPIDLCKMCCMRGASAPKRCGGRPRASSRACSRPISVSSLSPESPGAPRSRLAACPGARWSSPAAAPCPVSGCWAPGPEEAPDAGPAEDEGPGGPFDGGAAPSMALGTPRSPAPAACALDEAPDDEDDDDGAPPPPLLLSGTLPDRDARRLLIKCETAR